jgi:hypothetical protein
VATLPLETLPFNTPLLLLLLHGHGTAAASAIDHATGSGQCAFRTTAGTPVASTMTATAASLLCWAASCVAASAGDAATSVAAEAAQWTVSASSHGRAVDALARRLAVALIANVATIAGCPLLPGSSWYCSGSSSVACENTRRDTPAVAPAEPCSGSPRQWIAPPRPAAMAAKAL